MLAGLKTYTDIYMCCSSIQYRMKLAFHILFLADSNTITYVFLHMQMAYLQCRQEIGTAVFLVKVQYF